MSYSLHADLWLSKGLSGFDPAQWLISESNVPLEKFLTISWIPLQRLSIFSAQLQQVLVNRLLIHLSLYHFLSKAAILVLFKF